MSREMGGWAAKERPGCGNVGGMKREPHTFWNEARRRRDHFFLTWAGWLVVEEACEVSELWCRIHGDDS